jgi:hypothetical protein
MGLTTCSYNGSTSPLKITHNHDKHHSPKKEKKLKKKKLAAPFVVREIEGRGEDDLTSLLSHASHPFYLSTPFLVVSAEDDEDLLEEVEEEAEVRNESS